MLSIPLLNLLIKPYRSKIITSHLTVIRVITMELGTGRMSRAKEPVEIDKISERLMKFLVCFGNGIIFLKVFDG